MLGYLIAKWDCEPKEPLSARQVSNLRLVNLLEGERGRPLACPAYPCRSLPTHYSRYSLPRHLQTVRYKEPGRIHDPRTEVAIEFLDRRINRNQSLVVLQCVNSGWEARW